MALSGIRRVEKELIRETATAAVVDGTRDERKNLVLYNIKLLDYTRSENQK